MEDVKLGGGLLGHLDKGGKFEVRQAEVAPGQWEMTVLDVDMKGKALLFKTIDVRETENHSDFHPVPDDVTLAEAADILNRQIVVASNR
jgi:glutamine synthetase